MKKELVSGCMAETYKHIKKVQAIINVFVLELISRGEHHDDSKFEEPEFSVFAEHTPELAKVEYGSPEYAELLTKVQPAIDHHYANNRHHPENWPDGISSMTLVDLLEMLADWKAATERNKNGNIKKSLEINAERYHIEPQLLQILQNTVREHFTE